MVKLVRGKKPSPALNENERGIRAYPRQKPGREPRSADTERTLARRVMMRDMNTHRPSRWSGLAMAIAALAAVLSPVTASADATDDYPIPNRMIKTSCTAEQIMAAARDVEPVYYERYMIDYNNKSPEIQQAAQDYIHDFFAKSPAERRAWSEELATNAFSDPLAFQWPNHSKLFFNNKGVAANTTDICQQYPAGDMSLWVW